MNDTQSTPLNELPSKDTNDIDYNDQDTQIVNEILGDLDNQVNSSNSVFNRQVDKEVSQPRNNIGEPTPEQILSMSEYESENQNDNQNDNQNRKQNEMNYNNSSFQEEQQIQLKNKMEVNVNKNNTLFNYFKNSIFVIAIIFLLSSPVFNLVLKKIPKALDLTNQATLIGNLIKSILGGLLFFILEKLI